MTDGATSDADATIQVPPGKLSGRRFNGFAVRGSGRPHAKESERRALEMARLVASGLSLKDAALEAGVNGIRALDLIESPDWLSLVEGLRDAA